MSKGHLIEHIIGMFDKTTIFIISLFHSIYIEIILLLVINVLMFYSI